jgi:hypothetical protein
LWDMAGRQARRGSYVCPDLIDSCACGLLFRILVQKVRNK